MTSPDIRDELQAHVLEVVQTFESLVGASGIESRVEQVGPQTFIKLVVGREAPIYEFALQELRRRLDNNPFSGLIRLALEPADRFPASVEASALAILLTRATRPVSQGNRPEGFVVPYVPFQNREDHKVAQPATQLIVGRRGVGKSTLVMRARDLLSGGRDLIVALDCQAYSELSGPGLHREVLRDLFLEMRQSVQTATTASGKPIGLHGIESALGLLDSPDHEVPSLVPRLRRVLANLTKVTEGQAYFFLDDFHLVDPKEQPLLLQTLHGVAKGANGWLKIAGLRSLLNHYDPVKRKGLQIPGDAQLVSLDLTLEDPRAAERHLAAILGSFMHAVGYSSYASVLPTPAFRRLVWANAGVPRDFLQMFARSLEHASKARNASVTLGDINIAIGELGQRKLDEMQEDARNEEGRLRKVVDYLLDFCLTQREPRVNAFLMRAELSEERAVIATLSDLRLLHLIHQSITPDRAGEAYQAYILDYSLFTGFRRKRNVKEMLPEEGEQFKASVLRQLRKLPATFLAMLDEEDESRSRGTTHGGRGAAQPKRTAPNPGSRTTRTAGQTQPTKKPKSRKAAKKSARRSGAGRKTR